MGNSLRKELVMATLSKRGECWYARVQWRDINGRMKGKQISLWTKKRKAALVRLDEVKNHESYGKIIILTL